MITRTRTWSAHPGKAPELIAVLKDIAATAARLSGREPSAVATPIGGDLGEVTLIMRAESLAQHEELLAKALANPEIGALIAKVPALVADGGYEHIFQHV